MALNKDIGIDLGTANSLVFVKNEGIVLEEPSVVAIRRETGDVLAVGDEAKSMIGRTPGNIIAVRPMKDGVIADFDTTYSMIKYFLGKAVKNRSFFFKPRVIVCVPAGVTSVEERAVREAVLQAGAKEAHIIEEPMAAAIGSGLPINEPTGNMIVDIGGGTTDVAVISLGGIVVSRSIRVGGDKMDQAIISFVRKNYKLAIGDRTAEEIKKNIGNAYLDEATETLSYEVKGRDLVSGLPKNFSLGSEEINRALQEPVTAIVDAIKMCLEKTPPELSADIMDRGIVLAGGGALLKGLDKLIMAETGMPVIIADEPLKAVVNGAGKVLDNIDLLKKIKTPEKRGR